MFSCLTRALSFVFLLGGVSSVGAQEKPNIILILADDLGYSDIGCYGGEIATPNLDRLASEGVRFRQFYNDAKCGPSRMALLTGQYSHQAGKEIDVEAGATFAEVLKPAGYRTLMTGKWHQNTTPTDRGFDRYYGLVDGCCNYWNPGMKARPGEPLPGRKGEVKKARHWAIEKEFFEGGYVPEDPKFYTTDAFTDYAVDRLEEYKSEENPFVLYLAYTAPHYPLHAWPEDIAKYANTYQMGWDKLREIRHAKMKKLGVIDQDCALSPRNPEVPAWDSLSAEEKAEQAQLMAVYAAMVDRMDQGIGKVLAKLEEIGKAENTIVIFAADNGACSEHPDCTPGVPPGPVAGYRSVGQAWANASNTPYRLFKSTNHEGGIRTPAIVRWPGETKPGTYSDYVAHFIDFVPTFMELSGASYPSEILGQKVTKPDGISFLPVLKGETIAQRPHLFWKFKGAKAVRAGDWKLVGQPKNKTAPWGLFNLTQDQTELHDLSAKHPEKVLEMKESWEKWNRVGKKH